MVVLQSSDGKNFTVERGVAIQSVLIKNLLEDIGESDEPIPLPNVSSKVLEKVIEYCEYHVDDPSPILDDLDEIPKRSDDITPQDENYMKVDQELLFEILLAANYMDIKPLLELGCKTVANMIRNKTAQEIRTMFNIVDDFSPEEREQIKKENEWAEDH
ncbi:hypothetical protein GGH91_002919 [Coemansia sp. RSA 2671]|uniref:E3 ubiquitin ligase complex SCF subunit n=2 Tax=Coemansia TaxID=4863 RepID=A0A9W8GED2_9FUNG|nr:hypothetical protein LPJ60_003328 [Coemansia sp. RSA 2675]KAJ2344294.1 hypothetical protein GGH91_002919 [Coemansia sp. RSA 2671]KAJ2414123.1 hypothetical protein GGI10_002600 [Coemansia sp. RSA 2530]KAJ2687034.1 hypothetical protein IWW39_003205 [Coemansia spiralis]KAJ2696426.1 hypothetical protein H4218_004605 [Coemansia sp. IMI 209128]KAJ2765849.1 hypothetical protein GGI18_006126 [Coemansia linderi]